MNKIIVRFNREFYNKEAINEAISDFKEVCTGSIINDKMDVELQPISKIELLEEEFCNYVLGLMKNKALI